MQPEASTRPILDEDFDSEGQAATASQLARPRAWRPAVASAAVLAATALLALGAGAPSAALTHAAARPEVLQLDETHHDPCGKMPRMKLMTVKSNNLGGKGPDTDAEEGIFFDTHAYRAGLNNSDEVEIHMHAVTEGYFDHGAEEGTHVAGPYSPEWPKVNGITGDFGTLNVHPGTNVTLVLHAYDATNKKDIHLPKFSLTFFDLDTGAGGNESVEFLKINQFSRYFVSNETELDIREEPNGAWTFTATKEGSGDDNPDRPLELTTLQKNRAVSFVFDEQKEVVFELGASNGSAARVFQFVMRPIVRCAYTKLPDGTLLAADDPQSPVSVVHHHGSNLTAVALRLQQRGSGGAGQTRCSALLLLGLGLLSAQRWL